MTRAYLRLDPLYDENKAHYPDGPYAALVATICLAESQPERGRFRSERFLQALLDKRGRHVRFLLEHDDLKLLPDGRVYVVGWDEWQEGDWKVTERVARIRARRNGEVTPDVTERVTADRLDIAVSGKRIAVSGKRSEAVSGAGQADALDAYYRLTGSWPSQKVIPWLNTLSADHGEAAVSEALAVEWSAEPDRATLLSRTRDRLEREAHEDERRRKAAAEAAVVEERRAMEEGMTDEQRAANRERLRDMAKAAGIL